MSYQIGVIGASEAARLAGEFHRAGSRVLLWRLDGKVSPPEGVRAVTGYEQLAGCDLVVDLSGPDTYEVRLPQLAALDEALGETTVIVAATVFLSVNRLAAAARYRSRIVPAHLVLGEGLEIAELVRTIEADEASYRTAMACFATVADRVVEAPDALGGIYYRLLPLMPNISARLVEQGTRAEDIDLGMRYGTNFSKLPLQMADAFGLDNILRLLEAIWQESKNQAYRPHPYLRGMVAEGRLGVKSGRGFYQYNGGTQE